MMTPSERKATGRARKRRAYLTWQLVVNSYPCTRCGSPPGMTCVTDVGATKREPHAERTRTAHDRGWAFAEAEPRCVTCHGPLPDVHNEPPTRCPRCARIANPPGERATVDNPGPDGSYDVGLWDE